MLFRSVFMDAHTQLRTAVVFVTVAFGGRTVNILVLEVRLESAVVKEFVHLRLAFASATKDGGETITVQNVLKVSLERIVLWLFLRHHSISVG